MKWKLLALILLSCAFAKAQTISTQYQFTTSTPAAGTTANGGAANETNSGTQYRKITFTKTGTLATCSVRVDSSVDNVTWTAGGAITAQTCTSNGASAISTGVFNYTRINVTAISGGGSVKVVYQGFPTSPSGGGSVNSVSGTTNQINSTGGTDPVLSLSPTLVFPGTASIASQFTSTLATGTAPFVVASTTNVANLNASSLNGATFAAPGTIGGTTPGNATFGNVTVNGTCTGCGGVSFPLRGPDGSVSAPSYSFSGATSTGWYRDNATGRMIASILGGDKFRLSGSEVNALTPFTVSGSSTADLYKTTDNCAAVGTAANPSVVSCGSASSGAFSCATNASTGTCQVNTTAVTSDSRIFVQQSDAEGTNLGVTCNTNITISGTAPLLASKSSGASFTINLGTVAINPACFVYFIVN